VICRFCGGENVHHCPGGPLRPGDRDFDLHGDKRAFPGVRDAADHPSYAGWLDDKIQHVTVGYLGMLLHLCPEVVEDLEQEALALWDQSDGVWCATCDEDGTLCSCAPDEEEKLP
jgi:hypothetical protein